jgi:poly(hydroxyalkanoate) granule-associated protein
MARNLKGADAEKDSQLSDAVRDSAHEIWQAGLGAFEKARQEGGDIFALLVQEGIEVQKRTQELAEHQLSNVTETMSRMAGSVGQQATVSVEKLEAVIGDRLERVLRSLGIPTQSDVKALTKQVTQLVKAVDTLQEKRTAKEKPAAKKAAAKTTERKPAKGAAPKTTAKANGRQPAKKAGRASATRA